MDKSPDAFRTISEVADWLGTPTHVLRFWESRFTQVKPVKRAGGRRYYRPKDMALLGGIKKLLHDDGMTIRGVQKLLREKGVGHVEGLSRSLNDGADSEAPIEINAEPEDIPNVVQMKKDTGTVVLDATGQASRGPRGDVLRGPTEADLGGSATRQKSHLGASVSKNDAADVAEPEGASKTPQIQDAGPKNSDSTADEIQDKIPPLPAENVAGIKSFETKQIDEPEELGDIPGITGVAAALRAAASTDAKRNPDPEVFAELYARLRSLRGQMEHGSNPESSD